jgi:hypothetical protein
MGAAAERVEGPPYTINPQENMITMSAHDYIHI